MNESGLKKLKKVMNWGIKGEGKGTRTIQYPVKSRKELEMTSVVDLTLYSHSPRL